LPSDCHVPWHHLDRVVLTHMVTAGSIMFLTRIFICSLMDSGGSFVTGDIRDMSLAIKIPIEESGIDGIVKSLESKKFKTTKAYKSRFSVLDDFMAQLSLGGDGFEFGISKTKIAAQFLHPVEFVAYGDQEESIRGGSNGELFTKEKLDEVSFDFNYIFGLVLGRLKADGKDHALRFNLHLSKMGRFVNDPDHLVNPDSRTLFGGDFHLKGFMITMDEDVSGVKARTRYELREGAKRHDGKKTCDAIAQVDFQCPGSVDFFGLMTESMNRLNTLATAAVGGIDESG